MEGDTYVCEKCGNTLLKSNKLLHDLRCTSQNNNNINNINNNIPNTNNNNSIPTLLDKDNLLLLDQIKAKLDIMEKKIDRLQLHSDSDNNSESNSKNRNQSDNENEFDDDEVSDYGIGNDSDNEGTNIEINNNIYIGNRNRVDSNDRYISGNYNNRNNVGNNNMNNYRYNNYGNNQRNNNNYRYFLNNNRNNYRNDNYRNNQRNSNDYRYFGNINLNNRNNHTNRNFNNNINYLRDENIEDINDFVYGFGGEHHKVNNNIINNYPVSKIKDVDKLMEEKRKCCICLEDYKNDDEVLTLPCIHIFHSNCIKSWAERQNNCPICKYELK